MKIWVDDVRPAPEGYLHAYSVNEALALIGEVWEDSVIMQHLCEIVLDLDHDSGDYNKDGGDYVNILNVIEQYNATGETAIYPTIHIHSMNPVGVQNMRAVIQRNGWKEVF